MRCHVLSGEVFLKASATEIEKERTDTTNANMQGPNTPFKELLPVGAQARLHDYQDLTAAQDLKKAGRWVFINIDQSTTWSKAALNSFFGDSLPCLMRATKLWAEAPDDDTRSRWLVPCEHLHAMGICMYNRGSSWGRTWRSQPSRATASTTRP